VAGLRTGYAGNLDLAARFHVPAWITELALAQGVRLGRGARFEGYRWASDCAVAEMSPVPGCVVGISLIPGRHAPLWSADVT